MRASNDRLLYPASRAASTSTSTMQLRQRSLEARRAIAGAELFVTAPVGFKKTEYPSWRKDPDRLVQDRPIRTVRLGSPDAALVPRTRFGTRRDCTAGEVRWKRPIIGIAPRLYPMTSFYLD